MNIDLGSEAEAQGICEMLSQGGKMEETFWAKR